MSTKPVIRSVAGEKAAAVTRDSDVMPSDYPVATSSLLADTLRELDKNRPEELNAELYALLRLKVLLHQAQIQVRHAKKRWQNDPKVYAKLFAIDTRLTLAIREMPLKIVG